MNDEEINIPEKAQDPLAVKVRAEFDRAVLSRGTERVGRYSLNEALQNCFEQRNGILSCEDAALAEELGVDLVVNLTDLKCSALEALLRDLFVDSSDMPFVYEPTPIVELSSSARQKTLAAVKKELLSGQILSPEMVVEFVRQTKAKQIEQDNIFAMKAARNMEKLAMDQCVEGGFRTALMGYLYDFSTYPFACMLGPIPARVPVSAWAGDKFVSKVETQMQFFRVSPFDVFWTGDSPDAQKGTAVFVRRRVTPQYLYDATDSKSYIKENVKKVLDAGFTGKLPSTWTTYNPEDPGGNRIEAWNGGDQIDTITRYGRLKGSELRDYGIMVDELQTYETVVTIVGGYTIQAYVNPNPNANPRPVHIASFQKMGDKIPGFGIAQKVRDVERAYMAALRGLLNNFGRTLGPIGEVDMSRIERYISDEWEGSIVSNVLYPTDPDIAGGGRPAHYFHNVPSIADQALRLMDYFMNLADRVTQIPAAIHGNPVGTGANRTFRGMMALQGNMMKPIQSALMNLDTDVFTPLGTSLYNLNMRFSKDPDVKGDCRVRARGAAGMLEREMQKQNALETVQVIGQLGQNAQLNPKLMEKAVMKALEATGLTLDDDDEQMVMEPMVPAGVATLPQGV
jgi:hypothetical protein